MRPRGLPLRNVLGLFVAAELFKLAVVVVAFSSGGFQVEHQVFEVQPQLAQRVLNQAQYSATAVRAFHDTLKDRRQTLSPFGGNGVQG